MTNIVYRESDTPLTPAASSVKNIPLTNLEVDGNFKSLSDDVETRVRRSGDTLTGRLVLGSTLNVAPLNIPLDDDPTSFVNGDLWYTLSGLNFRIDGASRTVAFTQSPTFSGTILGPSGSQTSPGYSFSADPNTGFYRSGVGTISVSLSGVLKATIDPTNGLSLVNNLAVNGGSISTTSTTASIFNTNATTVSFGTAATSVTIGANTGTLTIGNPSVVGTSTTQNIFNTVATTLNIGGAATAVNLGAVNSVLNIGGNTAWHAGNHNNTGDPHQQYARKAGDTFTGSVSAPGFISRALGAEGGEISFNNPDNASTGLTVDVVSTNSARIFQTANNSVLTIGQLTGTGGTIELFTAGTKRLDIESDGTALFSNNIVIGTGGSHQAGSIYSDSNWGMIIRARQAAPALAEFLFSRSDGAELVRIDSSGYLYTNYFNHSHGVESSDANHFLASNDNFIRKKTATAFNRSLQRNSYLRETNGGTLRPGNHYGVWTGGGAITMNLPPAAETQTGDTILITNLQQTWQTNNFTINTPANVVINNQPGPWIFDKNVGGFWLIVTWFDGTAYWNILTGL